MKVEIQRKIVETAGSRFPLVVFMLMTVPSALSDTHQEGVLTTARFLRLTWPVLLAISLFMVPSNAFADVSLCGKWAGVSGWKGEYTLTGSGSIDYGGGETATVSYSSSGTLHLTHPGGQPCPSANLQWGAQMDSSNVIGSASYTIIVPCTPKAGSATETWSASQVEGGSAGLIVNPTQGSLTFSPQLLSTPIDVTAVGCGSTNVEPLGSVEFTPIFPSQLPTFSLGDNPIPVTVAAKEFSAVDGQTGITVNWTLSFTFGPDCDVPQDETTAWDGWDPHLGYQTLGLWKQTLISDMGAGFAGLTVNEVDASPGSDSCWFKGSAVGEQTRLTGSSWQVQDDNTWKDDMIGWYPCAVGFYQADPSLACRYYGYYQLKAPKVLPCGFTFHQQMQITCWDGSKNDYGPVNTLQAIIGQDYFTSSRAGHSETFR